MTAARDWITHPAAERAMLDADGWHCHSVTVRLLRWGRGSTAEPVVVMCRLRVPELFSEISTPPLTAAFQPLPEAAGLSCGALSEQARK